MEDCICTFINNNLENLNISNLQYKDKKEGGLIFSSCKSENEGFFYFWKMGRLRLVEE